MKKRILVVILLLALFIFSASYVNAELQKPLTFRDLWNNFVSIFTGKVVSYEPVLFNNINNQTNQTYYTLNIYLQGNGYGNIRSSDGMINCNNVCIASYLSGAKVTLIPTASFGSTFVGWGGTCTGISTCTLIMNSDKEVTATFNTVTMNQTNITGSIYATSTPSQADVYVDKTVSRGLTPLFIGNLNQGNHYITFTKSGYHPYQTTAYVAANQVTYVHANLIQINQTNTSIPIAPSNLQANALSSSTIYLTWQDNSNNEQGFKIERRVLPTGQFAEILTLGPNSNFYYNSLLQPSTTYEYRVRAYNLYGNSAYSNTATATTHPSNQSNQTINGPDLTITNINILNSPIINIPTSFEIFIRNIGNRFAQGYSYDVDWGDGSSSSGANYVTNISINETISITTGTIYYTPGIYTLLARFSALNGDINQNNDWKNITFIVYNQTNTSRVLPSFGTEPATQTQENIIIRFFNTIFNLLRS